MSYIKETNGRFRVNISKRVNTFIVDYMNLKLLTRTLSYNFEKKGGTILDVGAGSKPYFNLYKLFFDKHISTDVSESIHDISGVDLICPANSIPLENKSVNFILCTEVLEHTESPQDVLKEFNRLLINEGYLYLTVPFVEYIHEMPYDFYRFTPYGLKVLLEKSGFEIDQIYLKSGVFGVLIYIISTYQSKFWSKLSKMIKINLLNIYNPFVVLFIFLPQYFYIKLSRKVKIFNFKPINHVLFSFQLSLGFIVAARKKRNV
jgi:ubiquinone/menaquinone biosynthesis C-methylase UbiE